jgi:L-iditol 2-dehydrogenase
VAIIGLGFIGMMAAQVYQNDGYAVYGFDLDRNRLALAQQHGFVMDAFHPQEDVERYRSTLTRHLPAGTVDVVFLTAVNPHTIALALELIRDGGQLILFTSASPGTAIDPSQLYFREINLITSYSPSLADLQDASRQTFTKKISVAPLISHQMSLSNIGQAFDLYRSGQAMKVFIHMKEPV